VVLSHSNAFVLLAPWKTASSTTHLRLESNNQSPYSRFYDYNPYLQRVVNQHITYAEFGMLPESKNNYFVGAFVRNPYDRVYSGFLQLQKDIEHQPKALFPKAWIKALVMCQLADNLAQLSAGEFEFNKWFGLVEEYQIYEVGRNSSFPLHPAHYWTSIDRIQKVDFIGKVEQFEQDFAMFCGHVGIKPGSRINANISNQESEFSRASSSRYIHLMNAASISKVNTIFNDDFELFGYEKQLP
jgi:hypothetical protein